MSYLIYNVFLIIIEPLLRLYLNIHPKYGTLLARFNPDIIPMSKPPIWVQACSVGELNTARSLIDSLTRRFPSTPVLVTTSTMSGYALAVNRYSGTDIHVMWMPFDFRNAIRRFIEVLNPRILVLIETEIWPNLLRETNNYGSPVLIVNGRISDKCYKRYMHWTFLFSNALKFIDAVGVQNSTYAERYKMLGSPEEKIYVTGNMKFDSVTTVIDNRSRNRFRILCGFGQNDLVLVFGSTRPGDEALALKCWRALRKEFNDLRLVLVPRHLNRITTIQELFEEPYVLRSQLEQPGGREINPDIILVDIMGELTAWYALASVAVVGGSFYPGVEGHNPLEPAALGIPTLFGPYTDNFQDPVQVLLESGGAIQVKHPERLQHILQSLLQNPAERRQLGTRSRKVVLQNQGSVELNCDLVEETLLGTTHMLEVASTEN